VIRVPGAAGAIVSLTCLALACSPASHQTTASATPARSPAAATPLGRDYFVFVASEGNDQISLVQFGPQGARVVRQRRVGINPTELVGPHGLYVSPDGKWYYVSTAHGTPNGALWKFSTANDEQAGRVELGRFPATVQVSPDGHYAWVVNFNMYGDMVPSSVSVVYTDQMLEVRRIPTCVMPHGSRLSPDGSRQYSACMMDDELVEIDAGKLAVSRRFMLRRGDERGIDGAPSASSAAVGVSAGAAAPAAAGPAAPAVRAAHDGHGTTMTPTCSPTWAQPSVDGRTVWVACSKANDLVEIDLASWAMRRRIPAGDGIYNLAASPDGRLLVGTNKRGKSVSVIEAASGRELARIPTTRRVPSGLVISPDSRYAFVTQEGVGSEPGAVDVVDLRALRRVASVDLGQQAGGIDFWKSEP
jgi:DNA-binding beta-propeller fold protein YncE